MYKKHTDYICIMDAIFEMGQLPLVAKQFVKQITKSKIWAFYAPMGVGKTTFIQAVCKELKINETVNSPTFSIVNEYKSLVVGTVYHMDWYRLKDAEEAINAGIEDILLSGNICFIEWPEKATNLLPETSVAVFMEVLDDVTRRIFIPSPYEED